MIVKIIRIYEVDIPAETQKKNIENEAMKLLEETERSTEIALVDEYVYPEGEATKEMLDNIIELL